MLPVRLPYLPPFYPTHFLAHSSWMLQYQYLHRRSRLTWQCLQVHRRVCRFYRTCEYSCDRILSRSLSRWSGYARCLYQLWCNCFGRCCRLGWSSPSTTNDHTSFCLLLLCLRPICGNLLFSCRPCRTLSPFGRPFYLLDHLTYRCHNLLVCEPSYPYLL